MQFRGLTHASFLPEMAWVRRVVRKQKYTPLQKSELTVLCSDVILSLTIGFALPVPVAHVT